MDANEIKRMLVDRIEEVCHKLLPTGKKARGDWRVGGLDGEKGASMSVKLTGNQAGMFNDFATGNAGSNPLELWRQVRNVSFKEALAEAKDWLGVRDDTNKNIKRSNEPRYNAPNSPPKNRVVNSRGEILHTLGYWMMDERSIPTDVQHMYDLREQNGNLVWVYWADPERKSIDFLKYQSWSEDGKKKIWTSKEPKKTLFGKHTIDDDVSKITITEGETDALSYRACGIPAVSVPFGAKWENQQGDNPNDEWIQNDYEFLERFEEIILSFDMDEAGQMAKDSIIKRLGVHRCKEVNLPQKDANLVLINEGADALKRYHSEAKAKDPEQLVSISKSRREIHEKFFNKETQGLPLPWGTNHPFRIRWNELTIYSGFSGSGKTMNLNFLTTYFRQMGYRSAIASMEIPKEETSTYLIRQALGCGNPHPEQVDQGIDWFTNYLWFYNKQGRADIDDIISTFIYTYKRYGVRFFVVDSLMRLGLASDDYNGQKYVVDALTDFVKDYPVHAFLVAHSKKKDNEKEHSGKYDVKGASEITDNAHNVIITWRNKKKESEIYELLQENDDESLAEAEEIYEKKPCAIWTCEKQRNGEGDEFRIPLWFSKRTRQYHDAPDYKHINFIEGKEFDEEQNQKP